MGATQQALTAKKDSLGEVLARLVTAAPQLCKFLDGNNPDVASVTISMREDGAMIIVRGWMGDGTPGVAFASAYDSRSVISELNKLLANLGAKMRVDKFKKEQAEKANGGGSPAQA